MFVIKAGAHPKVEQLDDCHLIVCYKTLRAGPWPSQEMSGLLGTNALAYLAFLSLVKGIGLFGGQG